MHTLIVILVLHLNCIDITNMDCIVCWVGMSYLTILRFTLIVFIANFNLVLSTASVACDAATTLQYFVEKWASEYTVPSPLLVLYLVLLTANFNHCSSYFYLNKQFFIFLFPVCIHINSWIYDQWFSY